MEDYNFDVPDGMELMAYNRRHPDGGEARSVDTVDMVPMCRTVSCVTCIGPGTIPGSPVGFGGTLSSSDSDTAGQDGPYGTDGPVGHLGTLSPSTSTSEILVDPGGMSTSSDLAGMRVPAPPAESAVRRGPVALRCRQKRYFRSRNIYQGLELRP